MNEAHLVYCSSPGWAKVVAEELLPWALERRDLGDEVLELGPGPGLTTDLLHPRVRSLVCLELDPALATALAARLPTVEVVQGDASAMPFDRDRFAAVTTFTMLHHVSATDLQDLVLAESHRVLRPGGVFLGTDSLDTPARRELHIGDIFVPLEPASLAGRLERVGFEDVTVEVRGERILFSGRKSRAQVSRAPRSGGTSTA